MPGELLDELLVLVELLQVVERLVLEVDLLRAVNVGGIRENADGHAGARDMRKPAKFNVSVQVGMDPRQGRR